MKMTIDTNIAKEMFVNYGRDYYSMHGIEAILDYYDDINPDMEFDVIGICCDCTEYGGHGSELSFYAMVSDYGYLLDCGGYTAAQFGELSDEDQMAVVEELVERLEERTTVLHVCNGNYIVFAF